ncbi:MAG: DUF4249 family protein [Chitinophagaceae bacterium]
MKKVQTIIFLAFCIIFYSCEKNITITPPPYLSKPTIQCMLEADSLPLVYFHRVVPYFNQNILFKDLIIRNATMLIQSSAGTDSLKLDSVYDKSFCQFNYYYKGSKQIQVNRTYTLSVVNGADIYSATCQTNQLKPLIDSTSYTKSFFDLYGGHEGVIVYYKDVPSQINYYRYEMDRYVDTSTLQAFVKVKASPCLVGRDSALFHELGRSVYSDEGLSGQQIKIVIEPAYTHEKGRRGLVYIQSIDKNAYDFFNQLDKQKLAQTNPFVEPVFLKNGQFGNKAIGYFSAMSKSNPVLFVFPE